MEFGGGMERFVVAYPENLRVAWDLVGTRSFRALLHLADGLKNGNTVDWTAADLAKVMRVSERTAYRYLTRLKEKGLIARTGRLWMVNGRVFYRGRLSERGDNLRYFEETLLYAGASEECDAGTDLGGEGPDGLAPAASAGGPG
jgi:DNA-binding transcriptional ArsR family regulator